MTHPDPTAAARALAAVLEQENAALAALDLAAATALLSAKEAALAAFATAPLSASVPPPAGLAPLLRQVQALAGENRRLLARAIEIQSRVIALVARAGAPASAPGGGAYRAQGGAQCGRVVPPRPLACTLLARA